VEHATKYIQHVREHDPKGEDLHQIAVAKHTARLKQKRGIAEDDELTVLPEAIVAVSRTFTNRPRILGQPQDVQVIAGLAPEVTLSVRAQVCSAYIVLCKHRKLRWYSLMHEWNL
jgi:preprotein translocase subunit SecA